MIIVNPFELPKVKLENKKYLPNTCGLYFVLSGDRILYIGKTENGFKKRWRGWGKGHHREYQLLKMGQDILIAYWEVPDRGEELHQLEALARRVFSPELNQSPIVSGDDICTPPRKPNGMREYDWIARQLSISKQDAMLYFPDGEMTPGYPKIPETPVDALRQLAELSEY